MGKSEWTRKWRKANPATYLIGKIRWFERHAHEMPEAKRKSRCRILRTYATRYGLITRPGHCERCCCDCKPNAHHDDYAKPLAVQWFCRRCHNEVDAEREARLGIKRKKPIVRRWLTNADYDRIYALWTKGYYQTDIGRLMGVTNSCISKILAGKTRPRR